MNYNSDKDGKKEKTSMHRFKIQCQHCTKAGDLLYCKSRTTTECCFNNHSCAASWVEINAAFGDDAIEYLKDTVSKAIFQNLCGGFIMVFIWLYKI